MADKKTGISISSNQKFSIPFLWCQKNKKQKKKKKKKNKKKKKTISIQGSCLEVDQAVWWILKNNCGVVNILHLLDDFLAIDAPSADADRTIAVFKLILKYSEFHYH